MSGTFKAQPASSSCISLLKQQPWKFNRSSSWTGGGREKSWE